MFAHSHTSVRDPRALGIALHVRSDRFSSSVTETLRLRMHSARDWVNDSVKATSPMAMPTLIGTGVMAADAINTRLLGRLT